MLLFSHMLPPRRVLGEVCVSLAEWWKRCIHKKKNCVLLIELDFKKIYYVGGYHASTSFGMIYTGMRYCRAVHIDHRTVSCWGFHMIEHDSDSYGEIMMPERGH